MKDRLGQQERYEEALFAPLMDDLAVRLGADGAAENLRLRSDPAAAVPGQVNRRCMQVIQRGVGKARRPALRRRLVHAALAALIGLLLFATAFAASPELRARTIAFIMEVFDDRTEFRLTGSAGSIADYDIEAGWLPEGIELVEELHGSKSSAWHFTGVSNTQIRISIYKMNDELTSIDTEAFTAEDIFIQNKNASLVHKDDIFKILVPDEAQGIILKISGEGIEESILLRVAENLKILQN